MKFRSAHKLVKMGQEVGNIGVLQGCDMSPHFKLSSNGDSHMMLVSIFSAGTGHLGTIWYPTSTWIMYFTPYNPPNYARWRKKSSKIDHVTSLTNFPPKTFWRASTRYEVKLLT